MQPTAELLLKAFRGITLTIMEINQATQRFLSPLSALQLRILHLLGCSDDIASVRLVRTVLID